MNDKERKDLIKKLHNRLIEIDKEINKESNTKENLIKKKEEVIKINDKMNEMLNYIKKERNELDNKQKNVTTSNLEKSKKEDRSKSKEIDEKKIEIKKEGKSFASYFMEEMVVPIIGGGIVLIFTIGFASLIGYDTKGNRVVKVKK